MNTFSEQYQKAKTEPDNPYDMGAVGCYVDGSRGCYCIDAIESFAADHGYKLPQDVLDLNLDSISEYEFADELEDEIDDYMNENYMVHGAWWGRNENGDWGLWSTED